MRAGRPFAHSFSPGYRHKAANPPCRADVPLWCSLKLYVPFRHLAGCGIGWWSICVPVAARALYLAEAVCVGAAKVWIGMK
jgi:hypothetical protein